MMPKLCFIFALILTVVKASTKFPITNPGCAAVLCVEGTVCIETPAGGVCVKPKCPATLCAKGFKCIETVMGGKCVPIHDQCFCVAQYDPVCCKFSDGRVKTAGNDCECTGCGAPNKILYKGTCRTNVCVCNKKYSPVCCLTPKGPVTKGNSCLCDCVKGSRVLYNGRCHPKPKPCICTTDYNPVCCLTKRGIIKASNSCTCTCPGGKIVPKGCGLTKHI